MVPAEAVKTALAVPAVTVALAGTVSKVELELNPTTVSDAAVCESVTLHEVEAPELRLGGVHVTEETVTAASRFTVALAEVAL
jgi:hypothetical protein